MDELVDIEPSKRHGGLSGLSAAERFLAVAELRHRLCTLADNRTLTLLARTSLQWLTDAIRVLYRSIDFNDWLWTYPATGLAQASARDGVSCLHDRFKERRADRQPRKSLYGEAVKALRITNIVPQGAGFAHGVELHTQDHKDESHVKVLLRGPRNLHGRVPERDFDMSIPVLVQHLRPHFPKLRDIRIIRTSFRSEYYEYEDP